MAIISTRPRLVSLLRSCLLMLCLLPVLNPGFGQSAPSISYTTPQVLLRNAASTINPTNSGGAVPSGTYRNVSILAGTTNGFQDATGTTARFNQPVGLAIDVDGNLYVADTWNHRIRKVTPSGVVSTIAGSGSAALTNNTTGTSAAFNYPTDLVIHPDGSCLYVADKVNDVIRKVSLTSPYAVTTLAGTGVAGFADHATVGTSAQFNEPEGIAYDNSGATHYLYVADRSNHRIRRIQLVGTTGSATAGAVTTVAGTGGTTFSNGTSGQAVSNATFNQPVQVAVSSNGSTVYVADFGNHRVRMLNLSTSTVTTLAGTGTAGGTDNATGASATFNQPYGIEFDGEGNLVVSEMAGHRIRRISLASTNAVTTLAGTGSSGSTDANGTSASFNEPQGMVFDPVRALLYVCDYKNNCIREIEMSGYIVSPSLPTGLSLAAGTGVISGTPTAFSAAANYTVTAYNHYGSSVATINVAVADLPMLNTINIDLTSISLTTATAEGDVSSDGGGVLTARGVVWSTTASPTVSLSTKTNDGNTIGVFTSNLTGLTPNTTYYMRHYASSTLGTVYGIEYRFTTGGLIVGSFTTKTISDGIGALQVYDVYAVGSMVYAATLGGLSISTDGGATFTNRTTANGLGSNLVTQVYVVGSTVYAATDDGLSISTDGGATFTNRTTANGLGDNIVYDIYAVGSMVYAATNGGLSISSDGGGTFTNRTMANGLGHYEVKKVYVVGSTVYAATNGGLSISTDGGANFTNRTTTNGLGDDMVIDVYAVGSTVYAVIPDKGDGCSGCWGLSTSTDGGTTFTHKTDYVLYNSLLVMDGKLYIGSDNGLLVSANGGVDYIGYSVPHGFLSNQVTGVSVVGNKIYAATLGGLSISEVPSITWNGNTGTDWNTAANWSPGVVPISESPVIIPAGASNSPAVPATVTLAGLTVAGGSFNLGSSVMTLTGGLTNNGSISGSGKIIMSGSSAQTIAGTGTLTNLEINNSAGVTITFGPFHRQTITGVLTPTLGALITNDNLTLRSDASGTARVAALGGAASISGNVVAERYIKQNANISGTGRAWRLVSIPVTGTGTLRNFFMNGSTGLDFTNSAAVLGETVGAGTPIVGHNHATAAAAATAQFDWIGVPNQVSSLRRYVGNASGGTFLSSDVPVMSTTYTSAEQGYMVFVRGDRRLNFPSSSSSSATTLRSTGSLKTGNQPVNVVPAATSKYTLVGNPYMSVLDLSALQTEYASVIKPSFWIWDANISGTQRQGGYVNVFHNGTSWVTNTGAYTNPQRIESGMAFFVEPVDGLSATTPIVIKEAHKSSATSSGMAPFGSETSDGHGMLYARLEMPVAGDRRELVDGVLIDFHKDFKLSLGDLSDREKMRNTISTGGIWLGRDQKLLAAEGLPWPGVDERSIPLYMSAVGTQKLVVRLAPSGLEDRYVKVWLKDNQLNTQSEMDVTKGLDYTFTGTGNPSSDSTRFEIVYVESGRPSTGVTLEPDGASGEPVVKLNPNPSKSADVKLSLRSMTPGTYTVHILDMTGRLVATTSLNHRSMNGEYRILEGRRLAPGTYIIRLSDQAKQPKETLRLVVE